MSELLPPERCAEIFGIVEREAHARGVREIEVTFTAGAHALTRFANNAIHQNVAERGVEVAVRPLIDGRTARATTNRLDDEALCRVVEEAVAITRAQEADDNLPDLAEPAPCEPVTRHFRSTAAATPAERARLAGEAIRVAAAVGQTAAGIVSTGDSVLAILNSRGVAAYHRETLAQFSITAMAPDSSGWAKATACDLAALDTAALARRAVEKASASAAPREAPPGRYTVILEPAAVLDLAGQMFADFSATALEDGRSFLAERLGAQVFGANISIADDCRHPAQSGAPFDGEGVPRRRLTLVDRGVPSEVAVSRAAARRTGRPPTGHGFSVPNEFGEGPAHVVIAGGDSTLEEMIASVDRGILVTRLWYIREVDPYEKIMTGMTRDGTFLIEGGRLTCGLRNFRFNQSLIEMLRNVVALGRSERSSGEEAFDMVVPPMRVDGFHFTEVTKF